MNDQQRKPRRWGSSALQIAAGIGTGIAAGIIGISAFSAGASQPRTGAAAHSAAAPTKHRHLAEFGATAPGPDARYLADWIAYSNDAGDLPFLIVDKKSAELYVFDHEGTLAGATPIL